MQAHVLVLLRNACIVATHLKCKFVRADLDRYIWTTQLNEVQHTKPDHTNSCWCMVECVQQYVLVEEDSGANNELEDVLKSLHGL